MDDQYYQNAYMANQMMESNSNGPCFLVSSLPEELANPDSLCNLFGYYGDVHKVKILRNKPDCALVQMAKPHQAAVVRKYLGKTCFFVKWDNFSVTKEFIKYCRSSENSWKKVSGQLF